MTEKLFTGMLSKKTKRNENLVLKQLQLNVILSSVCIPKVVKSATKKIKIVFQIKNLRLKIDLDHVFCMYTGGNSNIFK